MNISPLLIAILAIVAAPRATLAGPFVPQYDGAAIKSECSAKWGAQYDMVKYCISKRDEGFNYVEKTARAVEELGKPTVEFCADKWGHSWDMTAHCLKKNFEAIHEIKPSIVGLPEAVGARIMLDCSQKWEPQFDMIAYCMKKQAGAWRSINN